MTSEIQDVKVASSTIMICVDALSGKLRWMVQKQKFKRIPNERLSIVSDKGHEIKDENMCFMFIHNLFAFEQEERQVSQVSVNESNNGKRRWKR